MPGHATPLEALRAVAAADVPLAPVHAVTHARLCTVDEGRASARMPLPPGSDALDALATVLVLSDLVLGVAVSTVLGPGTTITTVRLSAQVAGGADLAASGTLAAVGHLEHLGGGTGLSSAEVRDDDGGLLARLQSRNAVLDAPQLRDPYASDRVERARSVRPERPVPWAALVSTEVDDGDGGAGRVLRVAPDPRTSNSGGVVQGGVVAGIAARALAGVLGAVPDELAATYLRPTPRDGAAIECRTVTEHSGRRLRSARTEVHRDGRVLLTASGSAYTV